jgi:ABC-type transport system involved in multi-copper enzyme maturation permease subunit
VSRARAGAYAVWQLRDYLKDRGLSTLVVAALSAYLGWSMMTDASPMPRPTDATSAELLVRFGSAGAVYAARMAEFSFHFMRSMLGALIFLGALFAMNGIVANDRKQGFFRFLFAKPLTPARYYGQAFVVHCVGFMLVIVLLALLYGVIVWPVLSLQFVLVVGLMFVAYAGVAFLLSAAARWDWLSLVAVSGTPVISAAQAPAIPWPLVLWFGGYGLLCYIAGLVVLRFRRLAIV